MTLDGLRWRLRDLSYFRAPLLASRLRRSLREKRDEHVRPFAEHVAEVQELYAELLAPVRSARAEAS